MKFQLTAVVALLSSSAAAAGGSAASDDGRVGGGALLRGKAPQDTVRGPIAQDAEIRDDDHQDDDPIRRYGLDPTVLSSVVDQCPDLNLLGDNDGLMTSMTSLARCVELADAGGESGDLLPSCRVEDEYNPYDDLYEAEMASILDSPEEKRELRGSKPPQDQDHRRVMEHGNMNYVQSTCNAGLAEAACVDWSVFFGNATTTFASEVKIPCGQCVKLDALPRQPMEGAILDLTAGGLNIVGKLLIPSNSDVKIITPYVFVQGELVVPTPAGADPNNNNAMPVSSPTQGPKVHFVLTGTEDVTFMPDAATDNAGMMGAGVGTKAFVVAGGKLDVRAIDNNCPGWVKLENVMYADTLPNVALNKPSSQISDYGPFGEGGKAPTANNGITLTDSTHTNCNDPQPWWMVDLEEDYNVVNVRITNRQDCCGGRLTDFDVWFLDENDNVLDSVYIPNTFAISKELASLMPAEGVAGVRKVKVQLRGTDCLSLSEVEVFGYPSGESGPVDYLTVGEDAARCWSTPGSRILLTSDTFDYLDDHVVTVQPIPSPDPNSTTSSPVPPAGSIAVSPLPKKKTSIADTPSHPDFAVEVALLDRSMIIEGEVHPTDDKIGGHIIVLHTSGVHQHFEGVQLVNMGQAGNLGKYPFHFHMSEDVVGSTVAKNVVWNSNQRCYVVHGSHNATIYDNIAYNTHGHCFMIEDGGEYDNTFERNLGARTKPLSPLPQEGETDGNPATFWITNPQNHWIGNVAAGSAGNGYWFELMLRGPSATFPINMNNPNPKVLALKTFRDNTAHSNHGGRGGITTYRSGYPAPPGGAVFENCKSYKNANDGIFTHGTSNIEIRGGLLADNGRAMRNFGHSNSVLDGVEIIGKSEHVKMLKAEGRENLNWCKAGGVSFQPNQGRNHGTTVKNCVFSGYEDGCSGGTQYSLYVENDQVRHGVFNSAPTFVSNTFADPAPTRVSACMAINSSPDNDVLNVAYEDVDGSLSGMGPGFFVMDDPVITNFLDMSTCVPFEDGCLLFCPGACLRLVEVVISPTLTTRGMTLHVTDGTNSGSSPRRGPWFSELQSHITVPIGLALPAPAGQSPYEITFKDKDGNPAWPNFASAYFERPPACTGGLQESDVSLVMPPEDGRCADLFSVDNYTEGIHGWQEHFSGLTVSQTEDGKDVVSTTRRKSDGGHVGLKRVFDASCFVARGGHTFTLSGKIRIQDANGVDVATDGTTSDSPLLTLSISPSLLWKTWRLETNGDGTWATFENEFTLPADMSSVLKVEIGLTDAAQKETLVTDWSLTRNPTVFETLSGDSWKVISGKGTLTPPDPEELAANRAAAANLLESSANHIIYRSCASCPDSHKEIYYRRWTPVPATLNLLDLMENNWISNDNVMGEDFSLYSTYEDAIADINRWEYCNYDAPGVGFPRDCGPTTWSPGVSSPDQANVAYFIEGEGPPTISPVPTPAPTTEAPTDEHSAVPSGLSTFYPTASPVTAAPISTTPTNLALNGLARASSECYNGFAYYTIDGNPNTAHHSCCGTGDWFMVDLGIDSLFSIDSIIIKNRANCCGGRLREFHVEVLDADQNVVSSQYRGPHVATAGVVTFDFAQAEGRFARVRFNDDRTDCLHMGEVEVWGHPIALPATQHEIVELALNKPASASSNYHGSDPQRSNDGNAGTIHHTNCNEQPWWKVDLGQMSFVRDVTITNRGDCCGGRLKWAWVELLDEDSEVTHKRWLSGSVGNGKVIIIPFNEHVSVGRYVRVRFERNECLHMAEVAVNGYAVGAVAASTPAPTPAPTPPLANYALNQPAWQISTLGGEGNNAHAAVNGNTDGTTDFTHTNCGDPEPWWKVDLGKDVTISEIKITNRQDCCGGRLRNFYVRFLDANTDEITALYQGYTVGADVTINVDSVTARFVKIQLSGTDCLQLSEVEVYGWAATCSDVGEECVHSGDCCSGNCNEMECAQIISLFE